MSWWNFKKYWGAILVKKNKKEEHAREECNYRVWKNMQSVQSQKINKDVVKLKMQRRVDTKNNRRRA